MVRYCFGLMIAAAVAVPAWAQDRLPVVPGTLVIHASNVEACLTPSGNIAPIERILGDVATQITDLRALAFSWSDVQGALQETSDFDSVLQAPATSVRSFPDRTVVSQRPVCQRDGVLAPPELAFPAGQVWLLPVEDQAFALPEVWPSYLSRLDQRVQETQHLATCLLLGGSLERQPALAALLATDTEVKLRAGLDRLSVASSMEIRLTGAVMNPSAMRLRGWDALLLVGLVESPPTSGCRTLTETFFGTQAPRLGADPLDVVDTCPLIDLAEQQLLRVPVPFSASSVSLDNPDSMGAIAQALDCLPDDPAIPVGVTLEGYASEIGFEGRNLARSNQRVAAVRAVVRQRLTRLGRCDADQCMRTQIIATGYGETSQFGADYSDNRVVYMTLAWGEDTQATARTVPHLAMPAAARFLAQTEGTCRPVEQREVSRAKTLFGFLDSAYGRELMAQLDVPDMVVLLHNQTGQPGQGATAQRALAKLLQSKLRGRCAGQGDATHVGYLYQRSGAPFEAGTALSGPDREDFFVLPPKITWMYPVSDSADGPDLAAFGALVDLFGLSSESNVDLKKLANPNEKSYRAEWLSLVDVLRYDAPVPMSDVLIALRAAQAGSGWVNLGSGWD